MDPNEALKLIAVTLQDLLSVPYLNGQQERACYDMADAFSHNLPEDWQEAREHRERRDTNTTPDSTAD